MTKRRRKQTHEQVDDSEWPARLGRMSVAIEAWRERATDPIPPEVGSSLATDSMNGLSVENQIWYSMCISSEHLDFAIDAMRSTSTMYPTAYMTVARTAFVGAVNAVWLLAPTRQERRTRALLLRADELRSQVTGFRTMRIEPGRPDEARIDMLRQLEERQAALQLVADELGLTADVKKIRFNQTDAIDWVAEHMHGVGNDLLIGATQSIWRSGSAAAHAQYYFGIMRMDRNLAVRDGAGSSIVQLRGDLETDVGPALAAAFMTLNEAFRLYDLRRVRHNRT